MKRGTNELDRSDVAVLAPSRILELDRDAEEAFAELVQAFRAELEAFDRNAEDSAYFVDEFVPEDEFTCHGCNLVLHRSLLTDEERILCGGCSAKVRTPIGR